nr:MAG TPA: hypothetical protein [Caudoviricetes sp.]
MDSDIELTSLVLLYPERPFRPRCARHKTPR